MRGPHDLVPRLPTARRPGRVGAARGSVVTAESPGGAAIADLDLTDASVLIVGATGGLGSRIARRLADAGATLTLVGGTSGRVDDLDVDGTRLSLDLRIPGNVEQAVHTAVEAGGGLDVVVNAAGAVAFGTVADTSTDTVEELFLLNTFMPMVLARAALGHLGDDGVIVNLSAVVAERPMAGMAAYSASKAALTAFDAALSREARRAGVRVVDVRPPHTETGLAEHPIAGEAPTLPDGLDPDDVADRVVRAITEGEKDLPSDAFG
jgi:cyclic-di-GMP-binding biofilm dispersal mediator protein